MSWATIHGDKYQASRNALRFIEPGQTLYCTKATSAKVYFRIDLLTLFAITRIVFIGETRYTSDGLAVMCDRDESRKLLSLFSSLDGQLWTPFGIYNQVHGDKISQVTQVAMKTHSQRFSKSVIFPSTLGKRRLRRNHL